MSSWMQSVSSRAVISAALVGIVGAAGLYIYERVYAEKRRAMLMKEMGRIDKQVTSMRQELQALRELQKESSGSRKQRPRKPRPRPAASPADTPDATVTHEPAYTSDSEYFTDYASVVTDGDLDSEADFYDVHSDTDSDSTSKTNYNDTQTLRPNGTTQT